MAFIFRRVMNVLPTLPKAALEDVPKRFISQTAVLQNNWPDWRMLKDHTKRQCVKKYGGERARINAIRKCDLLPREIIEVADKEVVDLLPRNSNYIRLVNRCAVTSRPRGNVIGWNLSRIVWRHLADYNKLSGVQRAKW